ncbi:MAG: uncharacterized protein PWP03_838 [Candidatus Woesearchaeota archaeon]|nr:uncharacterized protein [Candidatus Woesearchaeota archaeon]MDN5328200.1 uncharacterized protein [Candidatus Woesearchaeota archaeon]
MKILAFTDIHNQKNYVDRVYRLSKKADIVVFLGDLTIFGEINPDIVKKLKQIPTLVLMVHGNHDDPELFSQISSVNSNLVFLHKKLFRFEDTLFIGFGGGGFSEREPEFERFVRKNKTEISKFEKIVLLTHAPPKDSCLDELDNVHFGNQSFAKFLKTHSTKKILALSGHFHENEGKLCRDDNRIFCNPGPKGMILNF